MNLKVLLILPIFLSCFNLSVAYGLDLAGKWQATASLPDGGEHQAELTIVPDGEGFKGRSKSDDSERAIDRIVIEENQITLEWNVELQGNPVTLRVKAEASGATALKGKWFILSESGEEQLSREWKATKEEGPEWALGDWNTKATLSEDRVMESKLTISIIEEAMKGVLRSDRGEVPMKKVAVDGKNLTLDFAMTRDDREVAVRITASRKDANALEGKWAILDDNGQTARDGLWTATRQAPPLDLAGAWRMRSVNKSEEETSAMMTIAKSDSGLSGHIEHDELGKMALTSIAQKDAEVRLEMRVGDEGVRVVIDGKLDKPNQLKGTWVMPQGDSSDGRTSGTWTAERIVEKPDATAAYIGQWALLLRFNGNDIDYDLKLVKKDEGGLSGALVSPRSGEHPLESVQLDQEGKLVMLIAREYDGNEIKFRYEGVLKEGKLQGKVTMDEAPDSGEGTWTATRKP